MFHELPKKMDIEEIKLASTKFRNAINKCHSLLGITFKNFPEGSCGDAAPLLGTYLIENKLGEFQYYTGNYGAKETWSSHAWLQAGSLVVDITADQFPDITKKIIVEEHSLWHKKLNGEALNLADYRIYDDSTVSNLSYLYKIIMRHI